MIVQTFVPGVPIPQGSKQAFQRGGRIVLVEANKKLPAWRQTVKENLEAANVSCQALEAPVSLEVVFWLPRPKSVKRKFYTTKPDLDKLIRAINDAATDAGVIKDDSQVVEIVAMKFYEGENLPPGALISYSQFLSVSHSK